MSAAVQRYVGLDVEIIGSNATPKAVAAAVRGCLEALIVAEEITVNVAEHSGACDDGCGGGLHGARGRT